MDGSNTTNPPDFSGLKWVRSLWGLEPRWTVNLEEKAIEETVKSALSLTDPCTVEFLAQGAFNKLYTIIDSTGQSVIFRVTLPIDPKWKTLSEVATLEWVHEKTSLPVPRVLAYRADRSSPIGFEWIILERMPGRPWADVWKEVPCPAKERLVRRLAEFCSDTFQQQMLGIGNIFPVSTLSESDLSMDGKIHKIKATPGIQVQRIVSSAFITSGFHHDVSRGPFSTSREWLLGRLDHAMADCRKRLAIVQKPELINEAQGDNAEAGPIGDAEDASKDDDGDDPEDLENALLIISKLRAHLDEFFPTGGPEPEPSMIFHDDLNRHNVLVDERGELTAVVDWECVSALPLYAACQYPPFLLSKSVDIEPIKSRYQHDENGEVAELYWEHLEDYELTRLRRAFLAEMRRLQPGWVDVFESSQRQRDFDLAVMTCDGPFMLRRILNWLSDLESGAEKVQGLEERIANASL